MYVIVTLFLILSFVLILLCIPVEIELLAIFGRETIYRWKIKYLFNLVSWEIEQQNTSGNVKQRTDNIAVSLNYLQLKGLIEQSFILLKRIFKAIKFRDIFSDIHFSLGEVHYTGQACGYLFPLLAATNAITGSRLEIQPVFEDELKLEGFIQGSMHFHPVKLCFPCLAFICSSPARQSAMLMVRRKWKAI